MKQEQQYYKISEFAQIFSLSRQKAYDLVNRGAIKAIKLPGTDTYRISKAEIEKYKQLAEGKLA